MGRLVFVLLGSLTLGACTTQGGETVTYTDPERLSRFEVPDSWHIYDHDELTTLAEIPFSETVQGFNLPPIINVGFDGGPVRDVNSLTIDLAEAEFPIGAASVRQVSATARDFLSRAFLTQSVLPYYGFTNPQEVVKEDFSFGGGFDGVRALVTFEDAEGSRQGVAYLIAVSDPDDRRIYSMIAGCNRECFIANQETIVKVVDSWLVNKRA